MSNNKSVPSNDPGQIYREWLQQSEVLPQSKTRKILLKKLSIVVAIVGGIMALCLIVAGVFERIASSGMMTQTEIKKAGDDPVSWLRDIEDYKRSGTSSLLARTNTNEAIEIATAASELKTETEILTRTKRDKKKSVVAASRTEPNTSDNPWSKIYGGTTRGHNTSTTFVINSASTAKSLEVATSAKIRVRLRGAAASNPSGPVIAVLQRTTKIGANELPRGTEFHGESRGVGPGARVMMNFDSIIKPDGTAIRFSGRAISTDGRIGVVGVQTLGGGSDIAGSAIGSAVQATGGFISSLVGSNPVGAAIDGAVSPMAAKARRLDYDEDVVVLSSGATFDIYVDQI